VVAEEAISRGARIVDIDHAASQFAATGQRIELGRVDLTDVAPKRATAALIAFFACGSGWRLSRDSRQSC
jgi:hypothetical protein